MLTFSLSLQELEREMQALSMQIIALSGTALLFLSVLIWLLSRRFIKPITDLSEALGEVEVEMGEKTVSVSGNDELARLAESYNEMVARIRKANEEMKLAHEKLLQSEKLATLGVLSSSVAHRINNPLGGLFNCVSMLRRKGEDPAFRTDYLALIEEGLQSIRDTGVGIPEDKIAHVFDLFYSTKEAGEGTGLGMWMTYELVKKYKGDILLKSRENVGTTISLLIPEGV